MTRSKTGLWVARFAAASSITVFSGCETTGRIFESGGNQARRIVGGLEPTGVVSDTTERKELMKSSRALVESIDAEAIDQAVTQLAAAATKLTERIGAVSAEDLRDSSANLANSLRLISGQLETVRIDETLASVQSVADASNKQLSALDLESVNAVIAELGDAVGELKGAIETLKSDSSKVLARVDEIGGGVMLTLRDVQEQGVVANTNSTITTLRETSTALPDVAAEARRILSTANFVAQLLIGVAVLLLLCLAAWFVRLLRVRPA